MYRVKSSSAASRNRRLGRVIPVAVRIASEGMRWCLPGPVRTWSQREVGDRLSSALTRALVSNEPDLMAEVQPELVQVAAQIAFCWNPPPVGQGKFV